MPFADCMAAHGRHARDQPSSRLGAQQSSRTPDDLAGDAQIARRIDGHVKMTCCAASAGTRVDATWVRHEGAQNCEHAQRGHQTCDRRNTWFRTSRATAVCQSCQSASAHHL